MTTTTTTKILTLGHVGMGTGELEPFDQRYQDSVLLTNDYYDFVPEMLDDCDALVIWGGEDISPSLYSERASKFVYARDGLSRRDAIEVAACRAAMERDLPIIGVCRGAQLVCALAGGRLIQHVERHGGSHNILTSDGRVMRTTSVHHQMMYPFDVDHEMIAWSHEHRSPIHINQDSIHDERMDDKVEPEIVWFPKIKALAIQGHPEFDHDSSPFVQFCMECVDKYILNK